jgi:hypothetical protein
MPAIPSPTNPPPGLTVTSLDLISSALRLIGVLASGEPASASDASDSLMILNQMVDSWQAERLMIYTIAITTFSLVVGQQTYTLGAGGDFNTARPARIENYTIINLSNPAMPLELPLISLTDSEWAAIPVKNIPSSLPRNVYNDGSFPLSNLSYYPIPNINVNANIYAWQPLSQFVDLSSTQYSFPPAYLRAIRYNLAVDLAAEFPGNPQSLPIVSQIAVQSKAVIKSFNTPILDLRCDEALNSSKSGKYNIFTDMPAGH